MSVEFGSVEEFEALIERSGGVQYTPPPFNNLMWFTTPKPTDESTPYEVIEFFTRWEERIAVYRNHPRGLTYDDRFKHERPAKLSEVLGLAVVTRRSSPGTPIAQEVTNFAESMLKRTLSSIGDLANKFAELTAAAPDQPVEDK